MPQYKVTGPDGKSYVVNAPDGASQDDVLAYVKQNYAQAAPSQADQPTQDQRQADASQQVLDSMSGTQKLLAGAGKSFVDNFHGAQQIGAMLASHLPFVGDSAQAKYDELKAQQAQANVTDAPLMHSGYGLAGNIGGQIGQAVAGGAVLRGAGVAGNLLNGWGATAAGGAAQGLLQPLATGQGEGSRTLNGAIGTVAALGGRGALQLAGAGLRGTKALIAPLFDSGQDGILANTLSRFSGDAAKSATPSAVPGVQATLAEQTGDSGLAQLQRSLINSDPQLAQQFAAREAQNNAARLGLLQQVAGTPADLDAAVAARDTAAKIRYGQAFQDSDSQQIARQWAAQQTQADAQQAAQLSLGGGDAIRNAADAQAQSILGASPKMQELATRPAIQSAIKQAKVIAANQGVDIGDPMASLQGQHYVKMALDDALNTAQQQGIGKVEQGAIQSAKTQFVNELERQNPAYAQARNAFRSLSGPVNQLQVGQGLLNRVTSPQAGEFGQIVDQLGNPTITPAKFGNAVKGLDQIAKSVTGQKQASAADILSGQQTQGIQALLGDLSRQNMGQTAGKALGSNTTQNLIGQNLLSETANGIGLPGLANSGLLGRASTLVNKSYGLLGVPDELKQKLANVMLNPQSAEAQAILKKMTPSQQSALMRQIYSGAGLVGQNAGLRVTQQ